jgi:hypothetical protein
LAGPAWELGRTGIENACCDHRDDGLEKGEGPMLVDLNQSEADILQDVVKGRIDELLMEIANTDARDYREQLKDKETRLQSVYAKLGCVHPEGSATTVCSADR